MVGAGAVFDRRSPPVRYASREAVIRAAPERDPRTHAQRTTSCNNFKRFGGVEQRKKCSVDAKILRSKFQGLAPSESLHQPPPQPHFSAQNAPLVRRALRRSSHLPIGTSAVGCNSARGRRAAARHLLKQQRLSHGCTHSSAFGSLSRSHYPPTCPRHKHESGPIFGE